MTIIQSDRSCMPMAQWPCPDTILVSRALEAGSLLEPGGSFSDLSLSTKRNFIQSYGRWLTWLSAQHTNLLASEPADRITKPLVRDFVRDLTAIGNSTNTVAGRVANLRKAATLFAPSKDWGWFNRIAASIRAVHKPAQNKRKRIVPAETLIALGENLICSATGDAEQTALNFRDGLLIALLASRPLRLKNFAALRIDHDVIRIASTWHIRIAAEETKTGSAIEAPVPDFLQEHLQDYFAIHRPILKQLGTHRRASAGNAVWISAYGFPMTPHAVYQRVAFQTRKAFGHVVNPHLFRDCAATTMVVEDPTHVGCVKAILGHRKYSTTERHYVHAQSLRSVEDYQSVLVRALLPIERAS